MEGGIEVVIAGPVFKQVAEDVKRIGLWCCIAGKIQKQPGGVGLAFTQVQVGNK
jgi:hypothetical protein